MKIFKWLYRVFFRSAPSTKTLYFFMTQFERAEYQRASPEYKKILLRLAAFHYKHYDPKEGIEFVPILMDPYYTERFTAFQRKELTTCKF